MKYVLGIDLGGTFIKVGVIRDGELLAYNTFASDSERGLQRNLPLIRQAAERLLDRCGAVQNRLAGVGIAFPGIVDIDGRRVISTNRKYNDAPHIDLPAWTADTWHCDCFMDNDARMSAVAEWKYGEGRGCNNMVLMTIGTGIGTAVIQKGSLMRGSHYQAGCLGGHFTINYNGRTCSCGNRGCIEAESGSRTLPEIAGETEGFAESPISREAKIDFEALFRLAGNGDPFCLRLRDRYLNLWGAALVNYIHAYDPEVVILGGGVLKSREVIVPHLQRFIDRYAWTPSSSVPIRCSDMYETSALLGAAYCALDKRLQ